MSKLPRKLPDGVHEAFTTLAQLYATVESSQAYLCSYLGARTCGSLCH